LLAAYTHELPRHGSIESSSLHEHRIERPDILHLGSRKRGREDDQAVPFSKPGPTWLSDSVLLETEKADHGPGLVAPAALLNENQTLQALDISAEAPNENQAKRPRRTLQQLQHLVAAQKMEKATRERERQELKGRVAAARKQALDMEQKKHQALEDMYQTMASEIAGYDKETEDDMAELKKLEDQMKTMEQEGTAFS